MNKPLSTRSLQNIGSEQDQLICYHCGDECRDNSISLGERLFCCNGCKTVYELLNAKELCEYYDIDASPGISPREELITDRFTYLDDDSVSEQLFEFSDGENARVTLQIPGMHCSSCIWLLEKLHELDSGITRSTVNFPRKQLTITFKLDELPLSKVAALLASLGYEPLINLDSLEKRQTSQAEKKLYYKIGIAGFAFGNVMLLSFPEYLSRSGEVDPVFKMVFGYLNLLLALPVMFYASQDYFRSAWAGLKQRFVNIDVPIGLGIAVLFFRSTYEILTQTGAGYLDSFTGLVFFLLIGRVFQQKTYDALSFERDYRAYFPLSVTRKVDKQELSVAVNKLKPGDRIIVRNQELIPADAVLLKSGALIDYSFVTGESDPVAKQEGDFIYAGGRQVGTTIELEVIKEPSQSYLTRLWNNEVFQKPRHSRLTGMVNQISKYFTAVVLLIAFIAGAFWSQTDIATAVRVFTAVLIVACPCALALATPFALGTAMRIFGRLGFYVKDTESIEALTQIDTIVMDKTGTLTEAQQDTIEFTGSTLSERELSAVRSLVRHSTHPMSQKIYHSLDGYTVTEVEGFTETPGKGLSGRLGDLRLRLGSRAWIGFAGGEQEQTSLRTQVFLEINDIPRGRFLFKNVYRQGLRKLIDGLKQKYELFLLSGDSEREKATLLNLFGQESRLAFNQTPEEKLAFVAARQQENRHVLMVGDGLNDAGALRASEVGIAVTEDVNTFSPASDAIIAGDQLSNLTDLFRMAFATRHVIIASFVLSFLYNIVGVSFAVAGMLSPLVSAILMPASSITVVAFTTFATSLQARRLKLV